MTQTVQLKFNGVTAEIKPVVDEMYDLNGIWRVLRLVDKKRLSEWNNKDRRNLERSGNFRNVRGGGATSYVTIEALYGYAMWCDFEFNDCMLTLMADGNH